MPVYEKLGDIRSRAVTLGQIADIHQARGEYEEALRLRRQEELPVYEKLGDIRERAVTLAKIAIVLFQTGQASEAISSFEREAIPVFEKLSDEPSLAYARTLLAQMYLGRNAPGDRAHARTLLLQAQQAARRLGLATWLEDINQLLAGLGET